MRTNKSAFTSILTASVLCACSDTGLAPNQDNQPSMDPGHVQPSLASVSNPLWSAPVSLGPLVNSSSTDQQPALSKDGLSLYFASNRSGGLGLSDLWVAHRNCTGCDWSVPRVVPNVNTAFADISPTLSRDGHQLFFASQRSNGHCSVPPPTPPQFLQCDRDLWVSYREDVHNDSGWLPAVNLGDGDEGINSSQEELAPSYFENDDGGSPQLFFNDGVIIQGALGGGDIYVSHLVNGTWGKPSLLPKPPSNEGINTVSSDQRPSISHDGLELYFWSDRSGVPHLLVATRGNVSDSWSDPSPVQFVSDGDAPTIMPFIHSHGKTETLLFVRPFSPASRDLWISQRTRGKSSQ
jgi:WD40 repeat protein